MPPVKLFQKLIKHARLGSNQSGVALMIAMFAIILMMYIVVETTYESTIEYQISSQAINRIRAYYAAKSGVELSLLRIQIYKKASAALGSTLGTSSKMLDLIWSFPLAWPPVIPNEASGVDKDLIKQTIKKSSMNAQYLATIEDEGSKIDLNDLASPSESLKRVARERLLNVFQSKMDTDRDWQKNLDNKTPDEIINNIADWMTPGDISLNGGGKSALYSNFKTENEKLPPNRPFRTLQELHLVAGINEDIYDLLAPHITIYGIKGVNPNHANKDVLMSLSPQITKEIADEIIKRRDDEQLGGPYKDENDFVSFVGRLGVNLPTDAQKKIPLVFEGVYNFRIRSTGQYGRSSSDIVAIVYDLEKVKSRLGEFIKSDTPENIPDSCKTKQGEEKSKCICDNKPTPAEQQKCRDALSKQKSSGEQTPENQGRPRIVYWYES